LTKIQLFIENYHDYDFFIVIIKIVLMSFHNSQGHKWLFITLLSNLSP